MEVKTLGVTAYRYSHRGREEWNGDELQSLKALTDDNGKSFTVAAERHGPSLVVERTAPAAVVDGGADGPGLSQGPDVRRRCCLPQSLPTNQWNFRQVKQSSAAQHRERQRRPGPGHPGRPRDGADRHSAASPPTRYRYTGDLTMDQWFDDRGRWMKAAFTAFDGSTIEYILQE